MRTKDATSPLMSRRNWQTLLADNPTGGGIRVVFVASAVWLERPLRWGRKRYQEAGLRIREILLEVE